MHCLPLSEQFLRRTVRQFLLLFCPEDHLSSMTRRCGGELVEGGGCCIRKRACLLPGVMQQQYEHDPTPPRDDMRFSMGGGGVGVVFYHC